jgi:hypothetical protein
MGFFVRLVIGQFRLQSGWINEEDPRAPICNLFDGEILVDEFYTIQEDKHASSGI